MAGLTEDLKFYFISIGKAARAHVIIGGLLIGATVAVLTTYYGFPAAIITLATLLGLTGPLALAAPLIAVSVISALFTIELFAFLEQSLHLRDNKSAGLASLFEDINNQLKYGNNLENLNHEFMRNLVIFCGIVVGISVGIFVAATAPGVLNALTINSLTGASGALFPYFFAGLISLLIIAAISYALYSVSGMRAKQAQLQAARKNDKNLQLLRNCQDLKAANLTQEDNFYEQSSTNSINYKVLKASFEKELQQVIQLKSFALSGSDDTWWKYRLQFRIIFYSKLAKETNATKYSIALRQLKEELKKINHYDEMSEKMADFCYLAKAARRQDWRSTNNGVLLNDSKSTETDQQYQQLIEYLKLGEVISNDTVIKAKNEALALIDKLLGSTTADSQLVELKDNEKGKKPIEGSNYAAAPFSSTLSQPILPTSNIPMSKEKKDAQQLNHNNTFNPPT